IQSFCFFVVPLCFENSSQSRDVGGSCLMILTHSFLAYGNGSASKGFCPPVASASVFQAADVVVDSRQTHPIWPGTPFEDSERTQVQPTGIIEASCVFVQNGYFIRQLRQFDAC